MRITANDLRRDLSARGSALNQEHEETYGRDDWHTPSILFREDETGAHGNFHPASYKRIVANPDWAARLAKAYTASNRVAHSSARARKELDCANSSDALLMNVFCYPGVMKRTQVCALLGVEAGAKPEFGFRTETPRNGSHADRTEIDLSLGHLLIEAKLTESGFQTAKPHLVEQYCDLAEIFDVDELPRTARGEYQHYQLIRGALAAHHGGRTYLVLCDARRVDLREAWFQVLRAVRSTELRSRLALLTWQELAGALPKGLQRFLEVKYGIVAGL